MIESTFNAFQIAATGLCSIVSAHRALVTRKRAWTMLAFAAGVFFLGDLYWQLFLVFYGETPHYSYISYISWYASYLFLLMLLIDVRGSVRVRLPRLPAWLIPVFTIGMCVFYLQFGDWIGNLVSTLLMTLLLRQIAGGLTDRAQRVSGLQAEQTAASDAKADPASVRPLCRVILLFCFAEYASWTASCFWMGDTLRNPYFWADGLLSLTFLLLPAALRKAVGE